MTISASKCCAVDVRLSSSWWTGDGIYRASLQNFARMNFFAGLVKSNRHVLNDGTFANPTTPSRHRDINSLGPTFPPHLVKSPRSSPVVGMSFCLIVVRLGQIHPEARDEIWYRLVSPGRDSAGCVHEQIERLPMGASEPRKQEYMDSSDGSTGVFRSSLCSYVSVVHTSRGTSWRASRIMLCR